MPIAAKWSYLDHAAVAPLSGPAAEAVCRLGRTHYPDDAELVFLAAGCGRQGGFDVRHASVCSRWAGMEWPKTTAKIYGKPHAVNAV